jgi:hypothetical protein
MEDEGVGTHQRIQTVHEETSIYIDIVVENFGLKEERNAGGTPDRIQNAHLLRKHRRIVRGQIGRHNVERLRGLGNGFGRQVNPIGVEGCEKGGLIAIHREETLLRNEICERLQTWRGENRGHVHVHHVHRSDLLGG